MTEQFSRIIFGDLPAIFAVQLSSVGGPAAVESFGLERISERDAAVPVPWSPVLGADLAREHEITLFSTGGDQPIPILSTSFVDAHPERWRSKAHSEQKLLLLATPRAPASYDSRSALLNDAWGALLRLVVRAYADGVGTAGPPR